MSLKKFTSDSVRTWNVAVLFLTYFAASGARVFTPCELAHTIALMSNESMFYRDMIIPKIVCIAGYHNYSSQNKIYHPNGTQYYGLFGLTDEMCGFKPTMHRDLDTDLGCLAELYGKDAFTGALFKLCGPFLTRKITCDFSAQLMEPMYKDLLVLSSGDLDPQVIKGILESYALSTTATPPTVFPTNLFQSVVDHPHFIYVLIFVVVLVVAISSLCYFIIQRRRRRSAGSVDTLNHWTRSGNGGTNMIHLLPSSGWRTVVLNNKMLDY